MPPEDLPPLAPFPDLVPASQPAADDAAVEGPLLSSTQREEFALVAGSLQGHGFAKDATGAPQEGDFLITTPDDKPAMAVREAAPRIVLREEPVTPAAFLDLPAVEPHQTQLPDAGRELKSLAAALTSSAIPQRGGESRFALDEWNVAALVAPVVPEKKEAVPSSSPRDSFLAQLDTAPVLLPAPIAIEMPSPALITAMADHSLAAEPEPASFLFHPAAFPPFPLPGRSQPDFDEPLTFPVPSAQGISHHVPAPMPEAVSDPADRGFGMVLSGALLIILGMILACRIPALAMEADSAAAGVHGPAAVRTWHLHGEMFLSAAGAAALLLLGIGSATLRRWAPPIIHAAGWVVLLTVLVCMGTATASMFHLSSNATAGDAVSGDGTLAFALTGGFGIALPLGLIALFQRPSIARLCQLTDDRARWTDRRTVPALMVFVTGVLLAVSCLTLSIAHTGMPLFGEIGDGRTGIQAWFAVGILSAVAAACAAAGKRTGWWILFALTALLALSLFLTCQQHDWRTLAQLPAAPSGTLVAGLIAASAMLPALLILLMTRRAFAHHEA